MSLFHKAKKQTQNSINSVEEFAKVFSEAMQEVKEKTELQRPLYDAQRPNESDYGLSPSNPIFTSGLSSTQNYLERLCTRDRQSFSWSSYTLVNVNIDGIIVPEDKYELFLNGTKYAELYFVEFFEESAFPPAGLFFMDDDKDWDLEREAYEKDVPVEQLLELKSLEAAHAQERQKIENERIKSLNDKACYVQKKYPHFKLEEELQTTLFSTLINCGCDMTQAYEYLHRDTLFHPKNILNSNTYPKLNALDYYNILLNHEERSAAPAADIHTKSKQDIEIEASALGVSTEQLIQIREMEKRNAELRWNMRLEELKKSANEAEIAAVQFPLFNLESDLESDLFLKLIKHVEIGIAHEFLHFSDYYEAATTLSPKKLEINYCRKCGTKLTPDSIFCCKCGTKVR